MFMSMSPPSSMVGDDTTSCPAIAADELNMKHILNGDSDQLMIDEVIDDIVIECVGKAIKLIVKKEQEEEEEGDQEEDEEEEDEPVTTNSSQSSPMNGGLLDDDINLLDLLTPPSTDPESPASETIIGLIPDEEICLSEDSKTVDEQSQLAPSTTTTISTVRNSLDSIDFVCKWTNCDWPGTYDDLVDHIREIHVELQPYHNHIISSTSSSSASSSSSSSLQPSSETAAAESSTFGAFSAISVSTSVRVKKEKQEDEEGVEEKEQLQQQQQRYVCLWEGCKVYGKVSLSRNWLERHVLQHSGPRPFKCIVERCGARFKMRSALERHVNSHFNGNTHQQQHQQQFGNAEQNSQNQFDESSLESETSNQQFNARQRSLNSVSPFNGSPIRSYSKRKKMNKVRSGRCVNLKTSHDYFDLCVMEKLKFSLYQLNSHLNFDLLASDRQVTFHSKVIARRREDKTGICDALLHYEPEDILPDIWVPESCVENHLTRTVSLNSLSSDALAKLMEIKQVRRTGRKQMPINT